MIMEKKINTENKLQTYVYYISLSCFFMAILNIIHTIYVIKIEFAAASFIIPTFAGLLFGSIFAQIKILSSQLSDMAFTDSLTHIYNRLHFANFLRTQVDKTKRYGGTFSIIFFDLDNFKEVNDNYGHLAGDHILEQVTKLVSAANRSADIFARYGGEEFIILTPETDLDGALVHAERLRRDIENFEFKTVGHITSSFGVAEFNADKDSVDDILSRADTALYMAKELGRNRVEKA